MDVLRPHREAHERQVAAANWVSSRRTRTTASRSPLAGTGAAAEASITRKVAHPHLRDCVGAGLTGAAVWAAQLFSPTCAFHQLEDGSLRPRSGNGGRGASGLLETPPTNWHFSKPSYLRKLPSAPRATRVRSSPSLSCGKAESRRKSCIAGGYRGCQGPRVARGSPGMSEPRVVRGPPGMPEPRGCRGHRSARPPPAPRPRARPHREPR
jgi:hypothetical protein